MPRCQYRLDAKSIQRDGTFSTPKSVTSVDAWLEAACSAIPEIPVRFHRKKPHDHPGWARREPVVTARTIAFEFVSSDGYKAALVIDRQYNNFGR